MDLPISMISNAVITGGVFNLINNFEHGVVHGQNEEHSRDSKGRFDRFPNNDSHAAVDPGESYEDASNNAREKQGEEVDVISTEMCQSNIDMTPDNSPKPQKLVWFQIGGDSAGATLQLVRSYEDCIMRLESIKQSNGWTGSTKLKYDRRMIGCEAERKAYRQHVIGSPYPSKVWAVLDDPQVFEFLVNLYRQPMRIQIRD
ncbi:hypothetical protein D9619_002274 [Psilocybe cf. subviscida]|uniref:Uncharacterized protein n=1 Tax=Psilocybe cf. subviscida TaxID=2480587 RepID=A0A8H5BD61_9AGAR|nr:hypothetical protein D9619_002274 [Psilocybe cf. subviscida]